MSLPRPRRWLLALLVAIPIALPARGDQPADPARTDPFATGDTGRSDDEAEPSTVPPMGAVPPAVLEAARTTRNRPLAERMQAISEPLLGKPYVGDPLGEGRGIDADPLARYDAFDCLTFVEEVVALALAGDPAHAAPIRLGLRYGGAEPRYAHRHHFMELQWIPGAVAAGWLRPTTAEYGEVETWARTFTPAQWEAWGRRDGFALTDEQLPTGEMRLDWLPLDRAIEVADRIRAGSIVMAVREDRPWVPLWITHLGIVVPAEEPTFRHATRMKASMRTRDHGLRWYLEHLGTYENWKTAGVAIFEPVEFGPRLSRLQDVSWEGPEPTVEWSAPEAR